MSTYRGVNARLAECLNSVLNVKALVGAFNQEKALVGAFSVIVKTGCGTDGSFYSTMQDSSCFPLDRADGANLFCCSSASILILPHAAP